MEFFNTRMGRALVEGTLPDIARSLARIAHSLEKQQADTEALKAQNKELESQLEVANAHVEGITRSDSSDT